MKKLLLIIALFLICGLATGTMVAGTPVEGRLDEVLRDHAIPQTEFLKGEWKYYDNGFVFFKEEGETPTKEMADTKLKQMTVTPDNCVLTFFDEKTCSFRVGNRKFKLVYKLDPTTRELKATFGWFSVKGYLVQNGDKIDLIYTKANLEMMMNFLCPLDTHKYIRELCSAMAKTDGLTLSIQFSK